MKRKGKRHFVFNVRRIRVTSWSVPQNRDDDVRWGYESGLTDWPVETESPPPEPAPEGVRKGRKR